MSACIEASMPKTYHSQQEITSFFPGEILTKIFQQLDIKSALNLGITCRYMHQLQDDSSLWKYFCIRDFFGFTTEHRPQKLLNSAWKTYYLNFDSYLLNPFPGEGAIFQLKSTKDWRVFNIGIPLIRKMSFKNEKNDAVFTRFALLGYSNGSIAMLLKVARWNQKIEKYFCSLCFENNNDAIFNNRMFLYERNMQKAFKVLKVFNQLPADVLPLLEKLIKAANWKQVTPLTEEDVKKLQGEKETYSFNMGVYKEWSPTKYFGG
jgi:hypothetical protein